MTRHNVVWPQSCVAGSTKAAVAKAHAVLLPAVAMAAGDPVPDIRDAALHALVAFAQKAGSLVAVDKVRPPPVRGTAVHHADARARAAVQGLQFS